MNNNVNGERGDQDDKHKLITHVPLKPIWILGHNFIGIFLGDNGWRRALNRTINIAIKILAFDDRQDSKFSD
jgi:hypothetical protein